MLTAYNGTAITYDAIGNPTKWRDISSMTWEGRKLQSATVTAGPRVTYEYNSDGIRTKKTLAGVVKYDYVLDGSKILSETVTNSAAGTTYKLYYLYDASGSVQGFIYNNQYYYFQKNLQGDVIRILNGNGAVVTEYTYDAWGNVLTTTGSLASTVGAYNPFRYRGYYYDAETGFYYLQSRYYDPTVGRFLNADGIIGANGGIEGYNMFAYCNNSPIIFADDNGYIRSYAVTLTDGGGKSDIARDKENANAGQVAGTAVPEKYIHRQNDEVLINGAKMSDISFGFGNISDNGCGVIAAYNILITWDSDITFHRVKCDIILCGGLLAGGLLGTEPLPLFNYMFWKCGFATISTDTSKWVDIANRCDAVIVLTQNGWTMHYFAGIKQSDGSYIFYNSALEDALNVDIDCRAVDFASLFEYISLDEKNPVCIMGVRYIS